MMSPSLEEQMKLLLEKVDRILSLLEIPPAGSHRRAVREKMQKQKPSPPNADDIARYKEQFEKLYAIWDAGEELQAVNEHAMNADQLRQFADANNLNVTSKTPKQKVMQLIAGRFRERRQLTRTHFNRRSTPD